MLAKTYHLWSISRLSDVTSAPVNSGVTGPRFGYLPGKDDDAVMSKCYPTDNQ